jgi:hypothetical protein
MVLNITKGYLVQFVLIFGFGIFSIWPSVSENFFSINNSLNLDIDKAKQIDDKPNWYCQPIDEVFNPGKSDEKKLPIGVSYKKTVKRTTNYQIIEYEFGCASSWDYIIEVKKNGERIFLFTHIIEYQLMELNNNIFVFLHNSLKRSDNKWETIFRIIDLNHLMKKVITQTECFQNYGTTYSFNEKYFVSLNNRKLACLFTLDGEFKLALNLRDLNVNHSPGASGGSYPSLPFGIYGNYFYVIFNDRENWATEAELTKKGISPMMRNYNGFDKESNFDLYLIEIENPKKYHKYSQIKYKNIKNDIGYILKNISKKSFNHKIIIKEY